jgi:hypothetical protein
MVEASESAVRCSAVYRERRYRDEYLRYLVATVNKLSVVRCWYETVEKARVGVVELSAREDALCAVAVRRMTRANGDALMSNAK